MTPISLGLCKLGEDFHHLCRSGGEQLHPLRLPFTAARRVFDFFTSMTSLEVNCKDTSTFRVSFESLNKGLFAGVSFVSVLAMVLSEY